MSNPQATYSAHVGITDDGAVSLTVRKAIPAGIDGPVFSVPLLGMDDNLAATELLLRERGFCLAEAWQLITAFDGLRLEAELVRS